MERKCDFLEKIINLIIGLVVFVVILLIFGKSYEYVSFYIECSDITQSLTKTIINEFKKHKASHTVSNKKNARPVRAQDERFLIGAKSNYSLVDRITFKLRDHFERFIHDVLKYEKILPLI